RSLRRISPGSKVARLGVAAELFEGKRPNDEGRRERVGSRRFLFEELRRNRSLARAKGGRREIVRQLTTRHRIGRTRERGAKGVLRLLIPPLFDAHGTEVLERGTPVDVREHVTARSERGLVVRRRGRPAARLARDLAEVEVTFEARGLR